VACSKGLNVPFYLNLVSESEITSVILEITGTGTTQVLTQSEVNDGANSLGHHLYPTRPTSTNLSQT
jgi:hypothetical protein